MKVLTRFLLLLSFAYLASSTSCKKTETPPQRLVVPHELMDYTYFKKGTYWIYQDSATKVIDSVYVYEARFSTDSVFENNKCVAIVDNYVIYTRSSLEQYDYMYVYTGNNARICFKTNPGKTDGCHYVTVSKFTNGDYIGTRAYFSQPIVLGSIMYETDNSKTTYLSFFENKVVNGNTYNKVFLLNAYKDLHQNYWTCNYYISKNNGIIRKEYLTVKKVYNLIRKKIIQ